MQIKADNGVYLENPKSITLPPAGGKYIDDLAGAEVMRLTDGHDGHGHSFSNTYSVWPGFNCDNTRVWLFEQTGPYYIANFNPATFARAGSLEEVVPARGAFVDYETAFWSFLDADKIFILVDCQIWSYKPSTKQYDVVADLTHQFPSGARFNQLYVSQDDNRFAAVVRAGSSGSGDYGLMVYERSSNSVKLGIRIDQINGITMGKEGKYVLLVREDTAGGQTSQQIYNIDTGAVETIISDKTTGLPDYVIGHNDCGNDFIVAGDQWRGAVTARKLSAPHDVTMAWQYTKVTGWISWHVSMRADNEAWALMSTFGPITVPPGDGMRAFEREIFQVGVKPPFIGQVRRLVHDRSAWAPPNYWDSARAAISRDGKFVIYTSNNNGVSGVDRTDVFIAKIDPAPASDGTVPAPTPLPAPTPSPAPSTPQPSPDGTKAVSITDSSGNVWTFGPNKETLKNGANAGGGLGTMYKWSGGFVYVLGLDNNWWQWSGTKWLKQNAQEPGVTNPTPTPTPTPVPSPAPQPSSSPSPGRFAYEYTKASFTTEAQFETAIQNAAGQGYAGFITGPSGKILYGFRMKQ